MNELGDPDVSELHAMANQKAQKVREAIEKYENWRRIISENINEHLEFARVIEELKDVESIIGEDEGGGHGSLKDLESELKTEQAALSDKKDLVNELQTLMTTVSSEQLTIHPFFSKVLS